MTRCESYPPCFGTIYFPTAPLLASKSLPVVICINVCAGIVTGVSIIRRECFFLCRIIKLCIIFRSIVTVAGICIQSIVIAGRIIFDHIILCIISCAVVIRRIVSSIA